MGAEGEEDSSLHSIEEEEGLSNGIKDCFQSSPKFRPDLVSGPKYGDLDENRMLEIMNRMNRVVMILKVLKIIYSETYLANNQKGHNFS